MLTHDLLTDTYCQGITFTITDEDALAQAVAHVLAQEYAMAQSILLGVAIAESGDAITLETEEIDDIVLRRLKPPVDYHRDGFLFQLIMWLAAHLDLDEGDLVALPHAQASAKGQDSIVVHRSGDAVVALSICEDKATENPRDTVRDEVWPDIRVYERGGRRDELRSNIITTLGLGGVPRDEAIALVRRISWGRSRRYRVRVTIETTRATELFKGFDKVVAGGTERRRGETVHLPGLRAWMSNFAVKVEAELRRFDREA